MSFKARNLRSLAFWFVFVFTGCAGSLAFRAVAFAQDSVPESSEEAAIEDLAAASSVGNPPRLSMEHLSGDSFELSVESTPGARVAIQRSEDLESWREVTTSSIPQEGVLVWPVDSTASAQFFRVRLEESQAVVSIASLSPSDGEEMVNVTRETIVRLDGAVDPETITSDSFYLIAEGEHVAGRVVPSSTEKFATFFYDSALPASTEVRIVVEGDQIMGRNGAALDADGDGQPGGRLTADFRTLPLTRIPGTDVFGFVRDSFSGEPIEGATIRVDAFPEANAVTDENGRFLLEDMPAPEFFVHVDGSTAVNVPEGFSYPNVGKPFHSVPGESVQIAMDGEPFDIFLPLMSEGDVQSLSTTEETDVGFGEDGEARLQEMFPEVDSAMFDLMEVTFAPGAAVDEEGNAATEAALVPVPPDRIPAPLPSGLDPSLVISIQAGGASNFDVPAPVTFPNLEGLPPGSKASIFSFNHDAGRWESVGLGTVSDDGQVIVSDPGVGILAPGWHSTGPPPVSPDPDSGPPPGGWEETDSFLKSMGGMLGMLDRGGCRQQHMQDPSIEGYRAYRKCLGSAADCAGQAGRNARNVPGMSTTVGGGKPGFGDLKDFAKDEAQTILEEAYGNGGSSFQRQANGSNGSVETLEEEAWRIDGLIPALFERATLRISYEEPLPRPLEVGDGVEIRDLSAFGYSELSVATLVFTDVESDTQGIAELMVVSVDPLPEMLGEAIRLELPSNAPSYPIRYAAQVRRGNGELMYLRGKTRSFGEYELFIPQDATLEWVAFWDPQTGQTGYVTPQAGDNAPPALRIVPITGDFADADNDRLVDLVELVIGTALENPDTDGDGIGDGAEVEQNLDPLGGRGFPTGIIAALPLRGPAREVVLVGDPIQSERQTAYIATGNHGLAIVDASRFNNPIVLGQLELPGNGADVAVDRQLERAAVAAQDAGLHLVDVTDPMQPVLIRTLNVEANRVEIVDGTAYVAAGSFLELFDVVSGEQLQRLDLGGSALSDLAREGEFLYAMDESRNLRVLDIRGFLPTMRGSVQLPEGGGKLFAGGAIAYAAAANTSRGGFATADVSDPDNPVVISGSDAPADQSAPGTDVVTNGSGTGLLVGQSKRQSGDPSSLDLVDISDPANTYEFLTRILLPEPPQSVAVGAGIAFIADGQAGLQVVNYLPFDNQGQAPSVTLTAPGIDRDPDTAGIQVQEGSTVPVQIEVADDVQVRKVELLVDGSVVRNDVAFPFEGEVGVPLLSSGANRVTVEALAVDTGGNSSRSSPLDLEIVVDAFAPQWTATIPQDGAQVVLTELVQVGFSEPMDESTLIADHFELAPSSQPGMPLSPLSTRVARSGRVVSFAYPTLAPGDYTLTVNGNSITDRAGNSVEGGEQSIQFTVLEVLAEDFSGAITPVAPPDTVVHHENENSREIKLFLERKNYNLPQRLRVDMREPGAYNSDNDLVVSYIPAGKRVTSHVLHFDTIARDLERLSGSVTFESEILGIILSLKTLDATDSVIGADDISYGKGNARGLEEGWDRLVFQSDNRTVEVDWRVSTEVDQVRIITAPSPSTPSIEGIVFRDISADGIRDDGEGGIAGWKLFLDENGNGQLDASEPISISGEDDPVSSENEAGTYAFYGLEPGEYTVGELLPEGFVATSPSGGLGAGTVPAGSKPLVMDFGNRISPDTATLNMIGGPFVNPDNGLQYLLLEPGEWLEAEKTAAQMGGHLAFINNDAEQDWIFNTLGRFNGTDRNLWIGLYDPDSTMQATEVEGRRLEFFSITGELVTFTRWASGKPDGSTGAVYAHMWGDTPPGSETGFWNNLGNSPSLSVPLGVVEVDPSEKTTPDTMPPSIQRMFPEEGATLQRASARIVFSETMDSATLNADTIQMVHESSGDSFAFEAGTVSPTGHTIDLTYGKVPAGSYRVVLDAASITDLSGNSLGAGTIERAFEVSAYPQEVIFDQAVRYWRLGESSGNTAFSEVTGEDDAGTAHGNYNGGPTLGVSSLLPSVTENTAVNFADGQRVSIPNGNDINTGGPYTERTIEMWIQPDEFLSETQAQGLWEEGGMTRGVTLYLVGNQVFVNAWNNMEDGDGAPWGSGTDDQVVFAGGGNLASGETVHLVAVMEGVASDDLTGTIKLYLNGTLIDEAGGVGQLFSHSGDVDIGEAGEFLHVEAETFNFDGTIDEVSVYNSALSAEQVQTHYELGQGME